VKRIDKELHLSKKLMAYLNDELSDDERQEVDKLLSEDKKFIEWFEQFKEKAYLEKRVRDHSEVDVKAKWALHLSKRKKSRRIVLDRTWWAAASIIVVLGIGWWMFQQIHNIEPQEQTAVNITPGSSKAELIIENGKHYMLTDIQPGMISDDGVRMQNSEQMLSYVSDEISQPDLKPLMHTIMVPRGGEHQVILSDGSKVWLNAQSSLRYPAWFTGSDRPVELSGEAYFEVAHNKEMPFIVSTSKVSLQVLGTEFNMKAYEDEMDVVTTLVNGKVRLKSHASRQEAVILSPGEQALLQNGVMGVNTVNVNYYTAWKDGIFVFKDEPLQDMFRRLSRWYDFDVFFASESLKKLPFTGTVERKGDIQWVLSLLEQTQHVKFEINERTILVKEK